MMTAELCLLRLHAQQEKLLVESKATSFSHPRKITWT